MARKGRNLDAKVVEVDEGEEGDEVEVGAAADEDVADGSYCV